MEVSATFHYHLHFLGLFCLAYRLPQVHLDWEILTTRAVRFPKLPACYRCFLEQVHLGPAFPAFWRVSGYLGLPFSIDLGLQVPAFSPFGADLCMGSPPVRLPDTTIRFVDQTLPTITVPDYLQCHLPALGTPACTMTACLFCRTCRFWQCTACLLEQILPATYWGFCHLASAGTSALPLLPGTVSTPAIGPPHSGFWVPGDLPFLAGRFWEDCSDLCRLQISDYCHFCTTCLEHCSTI